MSEELELLGGFYLRLGYVTRCPICGGYTNEVEIGLGVKHPLPTRFVCRQAETNWHHEIYQLLALLCQTNNSKEKKFLQQSIIRAWRHGRKDGIRNNIMYARLARHPELLY